jgi:two-component system, cell cycle sensor histidine kinase and response regulator CckA
MMWHPTKRTAWILLIGVLGAGVGLLRWTKAGIWAGIGQSKPANRVYRIGWEPDPPFQAIGSEGQPTGLAIELVREAARRRGIRLEWVRQAGADAALREQKVDLWPLITIIPERKSYVHFTEPYLDNEHCFLVRGDSTHTEIADLASAVISHNGMKINERNLRILLPNARLLASHGTEAAIETMCQHGADAVFVDEYTAISALLGGLSCFGGELRLIPVPQVRPELGIGSTFAASAAADAIREEIGKIAGEGKLPAALLRWSYFSRRNLESIQALREAKGLARLLIELVGVLFGALFIVGWLTLRTLSERRKSRRAEAELRVTQENYRLLTEQAADGIFLADKDGRFLVVNSRLCEMLGYTEEEMWRLNLLDTYFGDEREFGRQRFAAFRRGSSAGFERLMRRKDGTSIQVEASVVQLGDGRTQEIVRDITERKQAEATLRESEERFRRVFEEGPLGLALVGRDYRFLKVNGALCEMVGYSEKELLEMSFRDITHPDDLGANVKLADKLFKREIPFYQLQKRYVRKNGEVIWIKLTASVIYDQRGEVLHGLGMIEDITEVKRTQEETVSRQKLEGLGVLAGGIAHDFNNLLGGILAEAELTEGDLPVGSPAVNEIQRIKQSALRGSEIVRELMIYAGEDRAALYEAMDVSRLVAEMLELLKVSISKHAVLRMDLGDNLPHVQGNAAQIRQVVMNLIINASEAIGEKEGVITVTTAQASDGVNLASNGVTALQQADEYVRLEVSDTGCGMTEAFKAKVFDPFFSTKFAGRGLGLAVVQGVVRAHGGAIRLMSAPGEGTTFQVFLPCAPQRTAEIRDAISSAGVERSHARVGRVGTILVVDDEQILRLAVSKALRKIGFSVMEACDGSAAINLIRAHKDEIDIVLLDVTLPGTPSREVFEMTERTWPEPRVIVTSAYSKETVDASFAGHRVDHFIRKPFQLGELCACLETLSIKRGLGTH